MGDIVRLLRRGKFLGWYVRYKDVDGRRKMRASHQASKAAARRYLVEIEARVARGLLGMPGPAAPRPTVAELCERFLAEYSRPRIKDLSSYRQHVRTALRRALPLLGARRAAQVQPADITRLRDTLTRTHAAASVRLTLAYLSAVYAWALRQGIVLGNPLRGVERPVPVASLDYLTREEVTALLQAAQGTGELADQLAYARIHLAVHVGLRKGELLGLRWQDLDLESRRLTVARSFATLPKSNLPRHLRLPQACVAVLRAWQRQCPPTPDRLVFPVYRRGAFRMGTPKDLLGLPALLKAAGGRSARHPWHLLRHTFASHFIMSGGNLLTLQKILGHSDVKMTQVYAHLGPEFLGAEMDRLKY